MGKTPEQTPHQRRYTDGKQAMKKCPVPYVSRERQTQTPVRHHHTPTEVTKTQSTAHAECWWGCLGSNANAAATWGESLAVSYKTKRVLTIRSSNCAPWYLPKGAEKLRPHRSLHVGFYSSFIHHCQHLQASNQVVLQQVNGQINCSTFRQLSIIQY